MLRTAFRGGACLGGQLTPKSTGECKLVFNGNKVPLADRTARMYTSVSRAKAARRRLCRAHGTLRNEWRYWPGDTSWKSIQMKVGGTRTVIFDAQSLHAMVAHVWTFVPGVTIAVTAGATLNNYRGANHVFRRHHPVPKMCTLRKYLYASALRVWTFDPAATVDADGFECYDVRSQALVRSAVGRPKKPVACTG